MENHAPKDRLSPYSTFESLKRLALALVIVILAIAAVLYWLNIKASFEPPYLTFFLNTLFIALPSIIIAVISVRSFLHSGAWPVLWFGIATVTFGMGTLLGGLLITLSTVNMAVNTSNVIFLIGAILHSLGAFFILYDVSILELTYKRLAATLQVYLGVLIIIGTVIAGAVSEVFPPFFIQGQGGTPVRQFVLGVATLFFLLAGLIIWRQYRHTRSNFLYWYSLGLLLMCLGMAGILLLSATGTPLNWIGRIAQYCGGIYLFTASLIAIQEARKRQEPVSQALARLLTQSESNLSEVEQRFRRVFEQADIGIAISNTSGRTLESNTALQRMLGYSREELLLKPFAEFTHADDAAAELALVQELLDGQRESYDIEKRYIRKNGSYIWVRLIGSILRGEKGEPLAGLALVSDISERKRAEEDLKESERENRALIETANSIILRWLPNGTIVFINDFGLRFFGYSREEMMGKGVNIIVPRFDTSGQSLDELANKIVSHPDKFMSYTNENVRKDGSIVYILWSNKALYDDSGNVKEILAIGNDVTESRKSAAALIESEVRLRAVLDSSRDVIVRFNLQTERYEYVSPAVRDMVGYSPEEFMAMDKQTALSMIHPDDVAFLRAAQARSEETGQAEAEYRQRTASGDYVWVSNRMSVAKDNTGRLLTRTNSVRDITQRKKTEAALRETRDYLDNLLNYANAPIVVWGPDFRITQFNHAFERLTGLSAAEAIGKNVNILFPYNKSKQSMEHIRQTMMGKRWETVEIPILRTDGMIRTVLWNSATLFDGDGETVIATIAQGQDITERKRAEETLRESERKYHDLFTNMAEEVHFWKLVHNEKGEIVTWRLVDVNPPTLKTWGRQTVEEIRGKTTDEIFGPGSSEHYMPVVQKIMTEGVSYSYEDFFPQLNKYFRFTSVPLGDYFITTGADITRIKQAEQALLRYTADLEAFSYSVSHDLRQPLRALGSFSDLLIEEYGDKLDETGKDYLNRIRKASEHMYRLTDDMLKLSRITQTGMDRSLVNLSGLAESIVAELQAGQPERQTDIRIQPGIQAYGDQSLLTILLQNLLENAWKFTDKYSRTRIEMGEMDQDGEKIYFIRDNGFGFDMRFKDKLFQPFQRLTTDKRYPGTGIGLAIVQRIVLRHGGRTWAEAEIGKGATFYFTLGG